MLRVAFPPFLPTFHSSFVSNFVPCLSCFRRFALVLVLPFVAAAVRNTISKSCTRFSSLLLFLFNKNYPDCDIVVVVVFLNLSKAMI